MKLKRRTLIRRGFDHSTVNTGLRIYQWSQRICTDNGNVWDKEVEEKMGYLTKRLNIYVYLYSLPFHFTPPADTPATTQV